MSSTDGICMQHTAADMLCKTNMQSLRFNTLFVNQLTVVEQPSVQPTTVQPYPSSFQMSGLVDRDSSNQ